MPRFRKLAAGDMEIKGVDDPVTVADKAAEKALIARLTGLSPGSTVVGEESFAEDPGILSRLGGGARLGDRSRGRRIHRGRTEFGTMVGLVRNLETLAGLEYHDPNTGDTLAAERGRRRLAARPQNAFGGARPRDAETRDHRLAAQRSYCQNLAATRF